MMIMILNLEYSPYDLAPTGTVTVGHLITAFGLFIIALCLFESAISLSYNKQDMANLARKLDLRTLPILAIGFIAVVVAVMTVAW